MGGLAPLPGVCGPGARGGGLATGHTHEARDPQRLAEADVVLLGDDGALGQPEGVPRVREDQAVEAILDQRRAVEGYERGLGVHFVERCAEEALDLDRLVHHEPVAAAALVAQVPGAEDHVGVLVQLGGVEHPHLPCVQVEAMGIAPARDPLLFRHRTGRAVGKLTAHRDLDAPAEGHRAGAGEQREQRHGPTMALPTTGRARPGAGAGLRDLGGLPLTIEAGRRDRARPAPQGGGERRQAAPSLPRYSRVPVNTMPCGS